MILLAPNGKPSNLTPEQYKLVRTPAFKEWFGDWENSPENSSKVVDSNGEPLVVYHGTKENWWNDYFVFNPQYEGKSTNIKRRKFGSTYFTSKKKVAQTFGNILIPVFLNFENPIVIDADYHDIMWVDNELETTNYEDDIIIKNTYDYRASNVELDADMSSDIFLVTQLFNKIKLADGTNTTFDSNNPDIRFDGGGSIEQNRDESLKKIGNFWNWLDENHWKEIVNQEDIEKLNLESTDSYGFNTGIYYESPNGEILFVFSQRSRIIKDKYGIVNQISLRYDKEPVLVLTYLVVKNKGIGIGSKAIKLLTELCDKFGITIQLQPKPIKTIGEFLSTEQLVKFYEKAGFKITYDGGGSDKIMEYKQNNFDVLFKKGGQVNYTELIEGYKISLELEKDSKKKKLYQDIIDGYQIASELNQPKKTKSKVILLAPNGKPSNLNPEQYKLVRTTAFKQWFGDWENDPKNSSQVIDENGEPLVVYRGDNAESKKGYTFKTGYNRLAFINKKRLPNDYFHYFVDKYDIALQYAENQVSEHNGKVSWTGKGKRWEAKVTPYFLNIRKPIDITPNNPLFPTYNQFKKEIKPKGGYMKEWYLSWYIPFWYGFFISYKYLDKIFKEKLGENYLYNDKSPESMNQEIIEYFYKERPNYRLIYEFFIEWKDEYTQSAWLGRLHTSMILNKVDGMVFLEDTHWYIETTKAENEKYEKGLLQLDPEIWKEKPKVFATLDSEQIKLADGTNTTFDGNNPDIRFDDGGRTL